MTRLLRKLLLTITALSVFAALSFGLSSAKAETTECTEIVSLPAVITVQGIYCFKSNLVTAIATGNAIEINTNNVTIDMNGFKLGGSSAGIETLANGFRADGRKNISIKNGIIRGFLRGVSFIGAASSGHLIEKVRADQNRLVGVSVQGLNHIIRDNQIINTTGSGQVSVAYAIQLTSVTNALIADNFISGVSETTNAYGIYATGSTIIEVKRNTVFDIKNATSNYGIFFSTSGEVTIIDNRIINPTLLGTTGIAAGTSNVACIDNVTIEYTTATSGCDALSGHTNL